MADTETLMKINNLLSALSFEDLMMVAQSASVRARNLAKVELKIGDTVQFDANTRGIKTGTLIKKNELSAKVLVGGVTWTIKPISMLKKVAA